MMNNKGTVIWVVVLIIVAVGAFFLGKGMSGADGGASFYKAVSGTPAGVTPATWAYCSSNGNGGGFYLSTSGTCWEATKAGASAVPSGLCGKCGAAIANPENSTTSGEIKSTVKPTSTTR